MFSLKSLLKTLNIHSNCCVSIEDEEFKVLLQHKLDCLETEYKDCVKHQKKIKTEIQAVHKKLAELERIHEKINSNE